MYQYIIEKENKKYDKLLFNRFIYLIIFLSFTFPFIRIMHVNIFNVYLPNVIKNI